MPDTGANGELAIVLLAAGASTRMRGRDKLLEDVGGQPLLRRQALAALATGAGVYVATPPDTPDRQAALSGLPLAIVTVRDANAGMGASIRAVVAALPKTVTGVAILPGDMPDITTGDLKLVLAAFRAAPKNIIRGASEAGEPGHPVVFPARLFAELRRLSGDKGARALLRSQDVRQVRLPAGHATTDLDTPEDWANWRAARNS